MKGKVTKPIKLQTEPNRVYIPEDVRPITLAVHLLA